jgi:hypothetical protein
MDAIPRNQSGKRGPMPDSDQDREGESESIDSSIDWRAGRVVEGSEMRRSTSMLQRHFDGHTAFERSALERDCPVFNGFNQEKLGDE